MNQPMVKPIKSNQVFQMIISLLLVLTYHFVWALLLTGFFTVSDTEIHSSRAYSLYLWCFYVS
jgi:hypothetical protein